MSFFSGIVDENDHVRLGGYPAPFREALGLRVEDFVPFAGGEENRILDGDRKSYPCDLWADLVHLEGAEPLASYGHGFYAETPAVTRNGFGEGVAYYLGTRPAEGYTRSLLATICERPAWRRRSRPLRASRSCVAETREPLSSSLSTTTKRPSRSGYRPGRDLLTGTDHDSKLVLDPLGVAVLREASGQTAAR